LEKDLKQLGKLALAGQDVAADLRKKRRQAIELTEKIKAATDTVVELESQLQATL
jgi:hypothetical protein